MNHSIGARLALALMLAAPAGAQQTPARDQTGVAEAIVTKAARNYKALTSMQADFKMTILDTQAGNEDSRGTLYQAGTDKFAMRFAQPANQAYVVDGKYQWTYLPILSPGQVTRGPAPTSATYGVNFIGAFLDNPIEKYRLIFLRTELVGTRLADVVVLDPIPKMDFKRATVWFDHEDGLPRRLEFDEVFRKRTLELTKVQKNITIAPDIFVFKVPNGVKVIPQ